MHDMRTLYDAHGWTVTAEAIPDEDIASPDGDCYSARDVELFGDTWDYVTLHVSVDLNGATIGEDWLSGVEHGELDGVTADAFDLTPPQYGQGKDGTATLTMGSPLSSVVIEAIRQAGDWLAAIGARPDRPNFDAMVRHFDPHRPSD